MTVIKLLLILLLIQSIFFNTCILKYLHVIASNQLEIYKRMGKL